MDFILKQLNTDFSIFLILKIIVVFILLYGFLKFGIFVLKNYIIYYLAKKLVELMEARMEKEEEEPIKTEREDELLRHEEKERKKEQAEKVEMERIKKMGQEVEQDFKIILPKATGKWQKMVMESRKDLIFSVAKQMQANKTMNFWQTLVKVQKEQGRTAGRGFNKY